MAMGLEQEGHAMAYLCRPGSPLVHLQRQGLDGEPGAVE